MLGLGDIELRAKEKIQSSGGRLDLLLEDQDAGKRYECELQLGKTDKMFDIIREVDLEAGPNYNKHYIGLIRHNSAANYCYFLPKKNFTKMLSKSIPEDALVQEAEEVGLDIEKRPKWNETVIRISKAPTKEQVEVIKKIVKFSMDAYGI